MPDPTRPLPARPMPAPARGAGATPAAHGTVPATVTPVNGTVNATVNGAATAAVTGARPGVDGGELLRGAAGVAQVLVESSLRLTGWTARASLAGTQYVVRRAVAGETATAIMQDAAHDLRAAAWRALGVIAPPDPRPTTDRANRAMTTGELRRRGAELMRLSNDVHFTEDTHPAFARILSEITPDEARILRFLYIEGPQPAIDVRTNRPLGIGSQLVEGGLTMIGEHAGCRNLDLVSQYLTNLQRLGLVEFSMEQVSNPQRYQVVEAQPKVMAAMRRAGRMPRAVHRSIHLNDFGRAFCQTCLPVGDVRVAEPPAR